MAKNDDSSDDRKADELAKQAAQTQPGLVREFVDFLRYNKKWWLAPILFVLLVLSIIVFLGSGSAAPFIYTLF